jgi:hypothetical protein
LIGLDLGQSHDPTALCVVERRVVRHGDIQAQEYAARHLERFELGTPYPDMVDQVAEYLRRLPRPAAWQEDVRRLQREAPPNRKPPQVPLYRLIIDATGVGRPVCDLFARIVGRPVRITVTAGHQAHESDRDEWSVPKPSLIGALQVALQTRRFKVPRSHPEAQILIKEAQNFQYKISTSGHDTYGAWREGTHDDLLFAVSLAVWYGEQYPPPPIPAWKPLLVPRSATRSRTGV